MCVARRRLETRMSSWLPLATGAPGDAKKPRLGMQSFLQPEPSPPEAELPEAVAAAIAGLKSVDYHTEWVPESKKLWGLFDSELTGRRDTGRVAVNDEVSIGSVPFVRAGETYKGKLAKFAGGYHDVIKKLGILERFGLEGWRIEFIAAASHHARRAEDGKGEVYGNCDRSNARIRLFSRRLLLMNDRCVFDTLLHEIAHALYDRIEPFAGMTDERKRAYNECGGHTDTFCRIDWHIGGRGERFVRSAASGALFVDELFRDWHAFCCTAPTGPACFVDVRVGSPVWFDAAGQLAVDAGGAATCTRHGAPFVYAYTFDVEPGADALPAGTFVPLSATADGRKRYHVDDALLRPLKRVADARLAGLPPSASDEELEAGLELLDAMSRAEWSERKEITSFIEKIERSPDAEERCAGFLALARKVQAEMREAIRLREAGEWVPHRLRALMAEVFPRKRLAGAGVSEAERVRITMTAAQILGILGLKSVANPWIGPLTERAAHIQSVPENRTKILALLTAVSAELYPSLDKLSDERMLEIKAQLEEILAM